MQGMMRGNPGGQGWPFHWYPFYLHESLVGSHILFRTLTQGHWCPNPSPDIIFFILVHKRTRIVIEKVYVVLHTNFAMHTMHTVCLLS